MRCGHDARRRRKSATNGCRFESLHRGHAGCIEERTVRRRVISSRREKALPLIEAIADCAGIGAGLPKA
jgi:hypothetical protein